MAKQKLERTKNGAVIHTTYVKVLNYLTCPCGKRIEAKDCEIGGGPTHEVNSSTCPKCKTIYHWNSGGFVYAKNVYEDGGF